MSKHFINLGLFLEHILFFYFGFTLSPVFVFRFISWIICLMVFLQILDMHLSLSPPIKEQDNLLKD